MNNKILVVLDGSKAAECVLPYIKTLALGFETPAKVILYSAIEAISSPFEELIAMDMDNPEQKRQYEDTLLIYLKNIARDLREQGVDVEEAVAIALATDDVADGILKFAKQNGIDVIVLSTHGKSRKARRPFGHVAYTVLKQCEVPILVVPTPGYRKSK